ncbi:hypothetical protein [Shimazuella kribbensis]|nr:hypothetical protein [Shimazuella kribbensis]
MSNWEKAKKEHGAGLFHSNYKSEEQIKKEKREHDREIQRAIDMGNKGKK